jgi:hypothetical protein
MRQGWRAWAAAVTVAGTVSAAAVAPLWLHAQAAPSGAPAVAGGLVVCAGAGGVLRAAGADGRCAPGQTPYALAPGGASAVGCDDCGPTAAKETPAPAADGTRLDALEARLRALERTALFEVVDSRGDPIFKVVPGGVLMFNAAGDRVAAIRAGLDGGALTGWSGDGALSVTAGAIAEAFGVMVEEGGTPRLDLGRRPVGNYSMIIPGRSGRLAAALGESRAGTGGVQVGDASGRVKASMTLADGRGYVQVQNAGGTAVVALSEGVTHAGLFAIGDGSGEPMVKMGVKDDRYGVVLAGPVAGFPLVPASGLPGSYILGCSGGAACGPSGIK